MTNYATKEEKSEVLYAFHLACETPTSKDIIEWTKRYPQYADDILEHAELLLAQKSRSQSGPCQPDEEMLAKGRSEAMSAIYEAEQGASESFVDAESDTNTSDGSGVTLGPSSAINFDLLLKNACKPIPTLARDIDIDRAVVAEVAAGRVRLPIGDRFLAAVASILGLQPDNIVAAIRQSLDRPRLGPAKARDRPVIESIPYRDVILGSVNMTPEQIQYWLDEPSTWTPGTKSD
tara:strand:+ start:383 stop:1084 length:702 start_codon:yes stop_codon:yes gene_type:complete